MGGRWGVEGRIGRLGFGGIDYLNVNHIKIK